MADGSTIMENHEFDIIENGLYCAIKPFDVNIEEWTYDRRHMGYQAITNEYEDRPIATIRYISTTAAAAMKLIELYNSLKKKGERVGYIEGIPEDNAMGEVYA